MTLIALATCYDEATLYKDEAPFLAELEAQGFTIFPVVWNSPEVDWTSYDAVLIRNTWDYHHQADTFRAWLDYLDTNNITVLNPSELMRWNMDKTYLQTLAQHNVKILPTVFARGQNINLKNTLIENSWSQAVVKPITSASGDNTWTITPETADESQQQFDWLNETIGMMIQAFAPQIHTEGEYSLVFFSGEYSHAVLKKPPKDGLFVQEEHGGSTQAITPSDNLIAQAQDALNVVADITGIMPLYARVDGLRDNEDFILMEMECIEPELYFLRTDIGAKKFVEAIIEAIS
ncbi:MAG: hypothetical protein Phog2KO_26250 [Phototrophicaceae bacterium]